MLVLGKFCFVAEPYYLLLSGIPADLVEATHAATYRLVVARIFSLKDGLKRIQVVK